MKDILIIVLGQLLYSFKYPPPEFLLSIDSIYYILALFIVGVLFLKMVNLCRNLLKKFR